MSTLTPQDGDRELAIAIIEAVAKWANETIPVSDEIFRKETTALCLPLIASHTRAAVERETAQLRAERDAALKANGELARALDIGPMSESARASLAANLTAAEATVEELRKHCRIVYYPAGNGYPIEHAPGGKKDQFDEILRAIERDTKP